jgi:hypothetical protein
MNAAFDRINEMRTELIEMARKEAHNLFRIARKADDHGAHKTAIEIREEAWELYTTYEAYPERIIEWNFPRKHKHAFRY